MAQSVWIAIPSKHEYRIIDVTDRPSTASEDFSTIEEFARASDARHAVVAAVRAASAQQRRVSSICKVNMDVLMIVD